MRRKLKKRPLLLQLGALGTLLVLVLMFLIFPGNKPALKTNPINAHRQEGSEVGPHYGESDEVPRKKHAIWQNFKNGLQLHKVPRNSSTSVPPQPLTLIWWTMDPNTPYSVRRQCGIYQCVINSSRESQSEAAGFLFYASNMKLDDFPLPRQPWQLWGLLHEESPRNVPFVTYAPMLRHFNFTSTFSRYSDFPITTMHLTDERLLTSQKYMTPVGEKTLLRKEQKLAPIAFLSFDCLTVSRREDYMRELMSHIEVDSYGECLNNRVLPPSLRKNFLNNLYSPELLYFLGRYKFLIAYENTVCDDYITEKFWRPLLVGSIPIYFGAPTIRDWEPNNKSVIYITDFATPRELADFVRKLDQNDTEYNTYLEHKFNKLQPIGNERLRKDLTTPRDENLFRKLECAVCQSAYELKHGEKHVANQSHYNCPNVLSHPSMETETPGSFDLHFERGKCLAKWIDKFLTQNKKYTEQQIPHAPCDKN